MESVSRLVAYSERAGEDAFSGHAKKRAQRIMHYNVSFRPFTATIQAKSVVAGRNSPTTTTNTGESRKSTNGSGGRIRHSVSFEGDALNNGTGGNDNDDGESVSSLTSSGSVFMRTPTSFPPTPTSRLYYFERGSQVRRFSPPPPILAVSIMFSECYCMHPSNSHAESVIPPLHPAPPGSSRKMSYSSLATSCASSGVFSTTTSRRARCRRL